MKDSDFQKIISNLNLQKQNCDKALSEYYAYGDFENMPIKSLNRSIRLSRACLSEMDKFATSDLYHIIGMAKMNASQSSIFSKLTKELLKCRSGIKRIAGIPLCNVPKKLKSPTYELSSGIKLGGE